MVPLESGQGDVKELREQLVRAPALVPGRRLVLARMLAPRSALAQCLELVPLLEPAPMNSSEPPLQVR